VVGLVGGWQYRTMVVQLDRLQCAFDAAGRGEYGYSISLSGGDEWGDIETGFDDLLDDLAGRERVLERRRQRLEVLNRVLRHNLRTDVNVILGYADLLRGDPDDPRSLAGVIHGRAESLSELGEIARETQALMSDSASTPEPIDVGAELAKIVDELRAEFAGTRVELDAPPSVYVAAVPEITAALEHVCENACEHNDAETPRVDVSIAPIGDDRVRLTVADNGPGIPSHELDVLERGRETQLDHGSGLGLWLVKWAVDGSGGDLAFEPNEPRGTVVTIDLDAAAEGD
jgi:signal transduction histidine kinase